LLDQVGHCGKYRSTTGSCLGKKAKCLKKKKGKTVGSGKNPKKKKVAKKKRKKEKWTARLGRSKTNKKS